MKKLLEIANEELEALMNERNPNWTTYSKIADLVTCINYMQGSFCPTKNSICDLLDEMRNTLGNSMTLDIVIKALDEFCEDMNCVSPHLIECLKNKIKSKRS